MDKHKTCGVCGGIIGGLETPERWKNMIVCPPCYKKVRFAELESRGREQEPEFADRQTGRSSSGGLGRAIFWLIVICAAAIAAYWFLRARGMLH